MRVCWKDGSAVVRSPSVRAHTSVRSLLVLDSGGVAAAVLVDVWRPSTGNGWDLMVFYPSKHAGLEQALDDVKVQGWMTIGMALDPDP